MDARAPSELEFLALEGERPLGMTLGAGRAGRGVVGGGAPRASPRTSKSRGYDHSVHPAVVLARTTHA